MADYITRSLDNCQDNDLWLILLTVFLENGKGVSISRPNEKQPGRNLNAARATVRVRMHSCLGHSQF